MPKLGHPVQTQRRLDRLVFVVKIPEAVAAKVCRPGGWMESGRNALSTLTLTHLRMEKRLTRLLEQFYGDRRVQFGLGMILGSDILVPDVLVIAGDHPVLHQGILNELPLLCVEVLSPPRQTEAALARCGRYLNAGIPFSWVVDIAGRKAWEAAAPHPVPREVSKMFSGLCQLRLRDIFAE